MVNIGLFMVCAWKMACQSMLNLLIETHNIYNTKHTISKKSLRYVVAKETYFGYSKPSSVLILNDYSYSYIKHCIDYVNKKKNRQHFLIKYLILVVTILLVEDLHDC